MSWRELNEGDKVTFKITDYGGTLEYIGEVKEKHDNYMIIKSDLVITPEDKRKYDMNIWIDDDLAAIFDDIRKIS